MGFWGSVGSFLGTGLSNFGGSLSLHDATGGWSDFSARQSALKDQNKKNFDWQTAYQRWAAENMPTYAMAGYRKAGLNPILVAGQGVSSFGGFSGGTMPPSQGSSRPFESLMRKENQMADADLQSARETARANKAQADIAEYERDKLGAGSIADRIDHYARIEALTGIRVSEVSHLVEDSETFDDLVNLYKNQIETGRYTSSIGHQILKDAEDVVNSAGKIKIDTRGKDRRRGR